MLLWPFRDLPADQAAFVAINRLAARGLLPVTRHEVDFHPDAPATAEWREAVRKRCADYVLQPPVATEADATRGGFAIEIWRQIEDQPPPAWPRRGANDADADGIPDGRDPLPFDAATSSWPQHWRRAIDSKPLARRRERYSHPTACPLRAVALVPRWLPRRVRRCGCECNRPRARRKSCRRRSRPSRPCGPL